MICKARVLVAVHALLVLLGWPLVADAQCLNVYQPGYDQVTRSGFKGGVATIGYGSFVNNSGTAVAQSDMYINGANSGRRLVTWDQSGAGTALGTYRLDSGQFTAINDAGTVVGYAPVLASGSGSRPMRWDASGTPTQLDILGTSSSGSTESQAKDINDSGTAVGYAVKYVNNQWMGQVAVRWDASGTAAYEMENLGTDLSGVTSAQALAVNSSGMAVGYATRYTLGTNKGNRAVKWDASGHITELANTSTNRTGATDASAYLVTDSGMAAGFAPLYENGKSYGQRPVRWDATGAVTSLRCLGTTGQLFSAASAQAMNESGVVVGNSSVYEGVAYKGSRAVKWNPSSGDVIQLGDLGMDANGTTTAGAYSVSDDGTAVGFASKYVNGTHVAEHAVFWGPDGRAVDLNDVIDPTAGWVLNYATSISDNGRWITGVGVYDPDGAGGLAGYDQPFTVYLPCAGDANGDGNVDQADYAMWFNNYGAKGLRIPGDMNYDQTVDQADYALYFNNYGGGASGVPEPCVLSLFLLAGLFHFSKHKKSRSSK